jgi:mannosyltransferase OCH1-like enzyme
LTNAFNYKGQPSVWLSDEKMKRFKQGEEFAKRKQDKRGIHEQNQVFIYSKALSNKK